MKKIVSLSTLLVCCLTLAEVNVDRYGNIYVIDNPSYTAPSEVFYYSPEGKLIQGNIQVGYSAQNVRFAN